MTAADAATTGVAGVPGAGDELATASPADVQATFCATLVEEWATSGVRHAVIAPGSRSTPMALALVAHPGIDVQLVHDERSASFVALGIGLATGMPAALLCTSGTAATHFHGAVVEAHLSGVPMLVLTADRPAELRDVGAAQTIDQTHLFGTAARWFHDPGVAVAATAGSWRSLAERALAASLRPDPGPVHLNLPFREPLVGTARALPAGATGAITTWAAPASVSAHDLEAVGREIDRQRGVIVAGGGCADAVDAIGELADATGWPVLADPRSGCRSLPAAVAAFDSLLRHGEFADAHVPQVVLRLGEPPASKVLAQWLARSGGVQVQVSSRPVVLDPDHLVTHRVQAPIGAACRALAGVMRGAAGTPWRARWRHADDAAMAALEQHLGSVGLTEPAVAHALLRALPPGASLVVSSSMPVRDVEWFGGRFDGVRVLSNRGANGIDGVVATAIGVAAATGGPTAVLIGDVALLHDSSSLAALAGRGLDVRIVVVDNDGGGIFSFLPQAGVLDREQFEMLFGTPHGTDLVALAGAHRLPAVSVDTRDALMAAVAEPGPRLVHVPSDRAANVAAHDALHAAVARSLS